MALTGHSHHSGKITATTHLPCPLAYARVVLAPPSWSAAVAAGLAHGKAQNWPLCASPAKRA